MTWIAITKYSTTTFISSYQLLSEKTQIYDSLSENRWQVVTSCFIATRSQHTAAWPARPTGGGCVDIPRRRVTDRPVTQYAGHTDLPLLEVPHFLVDDGDALSDRSFDLDGRHLVSGFVQRTRVPASTSVATDPFTSLRTCRECRTRQNVI